MDFIFEWDRRKAHANLNKHGISFEEAKTVFNDPLLVTYPDDLHSEHEERFISIGYSNRTRLLLIVHTEQIASVEIRIRIISSRRATSTERQIYENINT